MSSYLKLISVGCYCTALRIAQDLGLARKDFKWIPTDDHARRAVLLRAIYVDSEDQLIGGFSDNERQRLLRFSSKRFHKMRWIKPDLNPCYTDAHHHGWARAVFAVFAVLNKGAHHCYCCSFYRGAIVLGLPIGLVIGYVMRN